MRGKEGKKELLYTYDNAGVITFINKKIEDVLGYKSEEIVGKCVWEFISEDYQDSVKWMVKKRLREEEEGTYVYKMAHKNGSERIIRMKSTPLTEDDCTMGRMVLVEDISERQVGKEIIEKNSLLSQIREEFIAANEQLAAAEKELRQQLEESQKNQEALADAHQQLETVIGFLPDPAFIIDLKGRVKRWNRAMEDMTGIKSGDILGKGNYEYAIPLYGKRTPLLIDLVLEPQEDREKEFLYIRREKDILFGESFCSQLCENGSYLAGKSAKLYDSSGNLIGAIESFRDISENKRAEQALRLSEEKHRNIVMSMEDGYVEVDYAGNFSFVNPAVAKILDYTEEELLGKNYKEIMDEENARKVYQVFNRVYKSGLPEKNFGYYVKGKKGISRYIEETVLPILNKGQVTGFRGIVRDMSEYKLDEEALRQSEEKHRNIIESIEDGYFEVDHAGNFSFVNPAISKMLDYSIEDMIGMNYRQIMDDENARKVYQIFNWVYISGIPEKNFGYYIVGKNRMSRFVEGAVLPIKSGEKVTGFRGIIRDMSERKRTEEALTRSERKYREQVIYLNKLIDNLNELFLTYDTEGRITFINKRVWEIGGYYPGDLIGRHILEFVSDDYKEWVMEITKEILREGKDGRFEIPLLHADGKARIARVNSAPINDEEGNITGIMALAEDITESKRNEKALRLSEARYRAVVEDQTEMIVRFLPDFTISFLNEAFYRYFGPSITIGLSILDIISNEFLQEIKRKTGILSKEKPVSVLEGCEEDAHGEIKWQEWTVRAIFDDKGQLMEYQAVGRDISERRNAEEKLTYLSLHDALTGLYNRNYFEEQMRVLEDGRRDPVGLIMCDVDGLKIVNDSLGHAAGDKLLQTVANILSRCFRQSDVLARVGGDEFAILLPETSAEIVDNTLSRIRAAIARYNDQEGEFPLSISMGSVIRRDKNTSMTDVYKEADNNMYKEKVHSRQSVRSSIVGTLMKTLESRDFISEGHGERLMQLAVCIGQKLHFSDRAINELRLFARFHDIGKVGIPDAILFKKGSLTVEERAVMQEHCEIGQRIALSSPDLLDIAEYILKHHEWWNGRGYPLGLRGEEIPLECRIFAIIDAYDAMTNDRPYRPAMPPNKALEELIRGSGSQFDPYLLGKFLELVSDNDY